MIVVIGVAAALSPVGGAGAQPFDMPPLTNAADYRGAGADPAFFSMLVKCTHDAGAARCLSRLAGDSECYRFNQGGDFDRITECALQEAATWDTVLTAVEARTRDRAADIDEAAVLRGRERAAVTRHDTAQQAFRAWRRAACLDEEGAWLDPLAGGGRVYATCLAERTAQRIDEVMVWGLP